MKTPMVYLATPKARPPDWGYVSGCISAAQYCTGTDGRPGIVFAGPLRGQYIEDERNLYTRDFLLSPATHLLFVDSDICWHVEQVMALLQAGKDVVCCTHHLKQEGSIIAGVGDVDAGPDGLARCDRVPGGFLLVSRNAILRASTHPDTFRYHVPEVGIVDAVWGTIHRPEQGIYVHDDYAFSLRCLEVGIELWRHTGIVAGHAGRAVY